MPFGYVGSAGNGGSVSRSFQVTRRLVVGMAGVYRRAAMMGIIPMAGRKRDTRRDRDGADPGHKRDRVVTSSVTNCLSARL